MEPAQPVTTSGPPSQPNIVSPTTPSAPISPPIPLAEAAPVVVKIPGTRGIFYEKLIHWLFRLGFASIFLVNSVYAAIRPHDFTQLLYSNPIASAIGFTDLMVKFAMVNDLILGVFILGGWRKKFVYAWAGTWLLVVAGVKLMNLVV